MTRQRILLWAALLLFFGPGVAEAQKGAAESFKLGTQRFEGKDYAGAITAFESAYKQRPHFLVLCNIARCYERLRRPLEATRYYQRCLDEGASRRRRTARKVKRALRTQLRLLARVAVKVPAGPAALFVDGKRQGMGPATIEVNPGKHTIEAQRKGHRPAVARVTVRAGEKRELVLRPVPLPKVSRNTVFPAGVRRDAPVRDEPPPPGAPEEDPEDRVRFGAHPAWFWVSLVVTGALAVTTSILGISALGKKSDYEENPTRKGYQDAIDSRLVANIMWAVTGAAAVGTTVLFFVTDFSGGERVTAGVQGIGVGWRGRF